MHYLVFGMICITVHLVFGINFQVHFVSLASLVLIHIYSLVNPSFFSLSPLSASITTLLFHSRLKTYLFNKSFQPQ